MNLDQKIMEIRINLFGRSVADIYRAIDGNSLMGAHILIFCLIDYVSYIREGEQQYAYNRFVDDYLSKNQNSNYNGKELYAIRCALVHTYGLSNAMSAADLNGYLFGHKVPQNHLVKQDKIIFLNLSNFLFDTVKSTWQCFEDLLRIDENDKKDVCERGQKLLKVFGPDGVSLYHKSFAETHPCLAPLDLENESKWVLLNEKTWELCANK